MVDQVAGVGTREDAGACRPMEAGAAVVVGLTQPMRARPPNFDSGRALIRPHSVDI